MKEYKERNLKIIVEYDGTNFHGWQRQLGEVTIQQHLEEAFEKILQEKITIIGSGRTDAGVHALGHAANFRVKGLISNWNLMLAVNSKLPQEIRVVQIEDAPMDFHAQYCAKSKIYRYKIYNATVYSPLICRFAYFLASPLVVAYMQEAAKYFVGTHDFFSLATFSKLKENTVRTINKLTVERDSENEKIITIEVEGDGFLYNMVRTIAGTLVEIGLGQKKPSECKKMLEVQDRTLAGTNLPAQGLTLVKVNY